MAVGSAGKIVISQSRIGSAPATFTPDPVSPDDDTNDDDDQNNFARLVVCCPLGLIQLLLVFLVSGLGTVLSIANTGLWPLLAIDATVSRVATNSADINAHEAVQHISASSWKVERDHVGRVIDKNIC